MPNSNIQPYDREKRVLLTKCQELELSAFLRKFEASSEGLRITTSDLFRGLLTLVLCLEDEILAVASFFHTNGRAHPATADLQGKGVLEAQLAAILLEGAKRRLSRPAAVSDSDIAVGNSS